MSAILNSDKLGTFEKEGPPHPRVPIEIPNIDGYEKVATQPRPGVFQTHLWPQMLPDDTFKKDIKIINTVRNPKDAAVSYYTFTRLNGLLGQVNCDWSDYFKVYMEGQVGYGNYFEHLKKWIKLKDNPNVKFVNYEDYIKDPVQTISDLARFIGKTLNEETLVDLARILSFSSMKNNPKLNVVFSHYNDKGSFMRKGRVGDWENYFTDEQNKIMDSVCDRFTRDTGYSFIFKLS